MASDDRLRTHPRDRLASLVQHVDLVEAAAQLRGESHAAISGHRQLALVRHGPISILLFAFEKDGRLKEHQVDGEVVIQVLKGQLSVEVAGESFMLRTGSLVALAPGQRHAVHALEESDMVLSIVRLPGGAPVSADGAGAA